ncbi:MULTISPECIES: hypothetical protein [Streptomyces]|uniref:Uncharacterized protein n=1 Tax=Streptomyces fradiae ATCC 10745 = DSM 40063 TaxID=1319510 RepID=A0A1Y2NX85_STRFR|nr:MULTISPECIES: hypothetical protein [Streptomyces]KAF0649195.1 hypothetical protein K701_13885 [Streptomyces fradiae ATCC 10745 = DSM 40063]OSY51821.1 hypothetical protein BG846_02495 [Streptomyces fradiae ATCC 10745 = DSM 40063]QEV12030.1 hypothetical protein CP974_08370 [Streptomyces fradiae ATCC 10745 = DSM 40063]
MHEHTTLTVTGFVGAELCVVTMRYPRQCWDDVTEADREELRSTARWRFANWARDELGTTLPDHQVNALAVAAT